MRTTLAVLLMLGGLIAGCSSKSHHEKDARDDAKTANQRDQYHEDVYGVKDHHTDMDYSRTHDGTPVSRGGPREDWNSLHSDPVCDMTVNPKTAAASEYYGGRVYYFDTVECKRRFHDNPSAFVPGDTYERRVQEVK